MTNQDRAAVFNELVQAAKKSSALAYCPYSSFPVGAALLTFDGKIYTGCNIENCGFTQTIHAEQTAMCNALADGALDRALAAGLTQLNFITAIAVHTPKSSSPWPCCNCRQSLNEFGLSMHVLGEDEQGNIQSKTLEELIPHAFPMEEVLASSHGKDRRLVKSQSSSKTGAAISLKETTLAKVGTKAQPGQDLQRQVIEAAKGASKIAYCPYSHFPVGAAVLTFDDQIYTGCNIENCGYTQTIHAEQVAIAQALSDGALKRALDAGLTQFDFIKSIAIYSPGNPEPWPSCHGRQALNEFGLRMQVLGETPDGTIISKTLAELIPHAFPMEKVLASVRAHVSSSL